MSMGVALFGSPQIGVGEPRDIGRSRFGEGSHPVGRRVKPRKRDSSAALRPSG